MRYVVWVLTVMCQISNLVCLSLITKKKEYLFEIKEDLVCDFNNTPINSYCIIVLLDIC